MRAKDWRVRGKERKRDVREPDLLIGNNNQIYVFMKKIIRLSTIAEHSALNRIFGKLDDHYHLS